MTRWNFDATEFDKTTLRKTDRFDPKLPSAFLRTINESGSFPFPPKLGENQESQRATLSSKITFTITVRSLVLMTLMFGFSLGLGFLFFFSHDSARCMGSLETYCFT